MYSGSDRMFYFAGENVLQDFHQTAPGYTGYTGNRSPAKDSFYSSFGGSPTKSVQIRYPEYDIMESPRRTTYKKNKDAVKVPPHDLGEEFAQILLDEFKRVRQISTKDPKVLLEFWKQNKRTRQKENDALNRSMRSSGKGDKSFMSQASHTSDRIKDLQKIAQEREEDVAYTLDIHSQIFKQEENIKKFLVDAYRQRKMEDELKKKQKPKKMSKETLDRLYKPPVPKTEPSSAQSTKARTTQNSMKSDYDRDFVEKLIELHAEARPEEKRYADADRLFAFWKAMPNKHDNLMNRREVVVREDIEKYYDEVYDNIQESYVSKYGYKTYDHKVLTNFHRAEISENEKKRKNIDYEASSLEKPLEAYCAKRKKEREEFEKQNQLEVKLKKQEEEKARLSKAVIKKEIKATGLKDLAKPKDNLQKGKTMLFLKKMFPNDRILQRMILNEFKKNKLLKYPEEYDVYDSDDEIETYQRDEQKEPFKTAAREGRLLKISDFNKVIYSREKDITAPFQKYLEQKYFDMNLKVEDGKNTKTREQREEKQLDRFISSRVRRYLQMRKRRLYEKIPSLKEFLIQTYREMRSSYKEATERKFPHITYGYSKRLKVNSYPVEFKRHFFLLVRAISRGTKMSKGKSLLPFWAPPSAGSKAHAFLDTNKSYNRRVVELSRENKVKKIEEDYTKTSCWEKEEFFLSRLSIMMTLSDAKECTFAPNVASKMPSKHKELMLQEYGAWANQFLTTNKSSFDDWVNAMGTNLSRRFPGIYKYGRFKKALRFWKEEQYIRAYKEIAETFNIDQIKKYFDPTYDPHKNQSVMFSKDNLKLENDGPRAQEDFADPATAKLLEDVYILVMFLESQEKDLQKSITEVKGMLVQDRIRSSRNRHNVAGSKIMMCPLGEGCSEDIRPRWPASSVKTISKFGQKCEFAHHTFELKFKQEINAKRKMLNNTLDNLNKKLVSDFQRPPFNPGGNVFTGCIGCGEELRTKGVSKGICSSCQLRKSVNKNLQMYRQKGGLKYLKITQKDSFKENYAEKRENASRLNTKLGYYRKACVLYENQRYRDAFTFIAKAVEIVKDEKADEEEKEQKKSDFLKTKLGIDPSVTITLDMLYDIDKKDGQETSRSTDTQYGLSRAKLISYAEKMGYIGEQKVDVNEFLNYQIQVIYLKIEKALQSKQKDISLLQKKIEKLEGFDEEVEEREAQQQLQAEGGFKSLSQLRREQQALKPKHKFDIDLVNDEKKIENLQKTVKYIQHEIEESTPPEPWRPTRMNNIILDIDKFDQQMEDKKPTTTFGKKPRDISETAKKSKGLEKSIYDRDLEDLIKLPNERSSPMKY